MTVTVTFDTNTLDRAVRPETLSQGRQQPEYFKIQQALRSGLIAGFFSETIVTLEGVQNADRVDVFGGTLLVQRPAGPSIEQQTVELVLEARQPHRKPMHSLSLDRVKAALQIGMRAMHMPRIGALAINDPDQKFFAPDDPSKWQSRIDRTHALAHEIEARGAGIAHVLVVAEKLAARDGATGEIWFKSLLRAKDQHEKDEVNRAIAEWADGDAVAAHYGYEFDLFCTEDMAANAGSTSVMSQVNRAWLGAQYKIKFVTLAELAARL